MNRFFSPDQGDEPGGGIAKDPLQSAASTESWDREQRGERLDSLHGSSWLQAASRGEICFAPTRWTRFERWPIRPNRKLAPDSNNRGLAAGLEKKTPAHLPTPICIEPEK
jgi:hypothetical protein